MAARIHLFGLDNCGMDYSLIRATLNNSVAVVAGKRLYDTVREEFKDEPLPKLIPVVPLADCIACMQEYLAEGDVVVLASGDPLFFGIGRRLIAAFPEYLIEVHPALSSMQLAFARFKLPWDDAKFISLHGRSNKDTASRVLKYPKVFLLTDPVNSPNAIAESILLQTDRDITGSVVCHVGESLGFPSERLVSGDLSEIVAGTFSEPNVMIILNPEVLKQEKMFPVFGLQEKEICHSRGLLTKNEVRAATIHALRLLQNGVIWDVGAGSGSVGLEVARLCPDSNIFSIEKEEEQWKNIEDNIKRFRVINMSLTKGAAPDALKQLPAPDRVFIGGSGGNLQAILEYCADKLLPGGIVVVNAVIAKTAELAPEILHRLGFEVEISEITVQRFRYPLEEKQCFNPIKVIVGSKPQQEQGDE